MKKKKQFLHKTLIKMKKKKRVETGRLTIYQFQ